MSCLSRFISSFLLIILCAPASAETLSAADIGTRLTPFGAEQAANSDGAIPAWDGGIRQPPDDYRPGDHHPDPYAGDKLLFTINANNIDQYKDHLTAGQKAMLTQYKDFRLPVYPTHRSASAPEYIYQYIKDNAGKAKLVADGNGVSGAAGGSPFPIPQNGLQAIWNHTLRFRGVSCKRSIGQAAVTSNGNYTLVRYEDEFHFIYGAPNMIPEDLKNKIFMFKQTITAPARLAGRILMAHETINAIAEPRAVWVYNPGQRRVRRAPEVAYDSPPPGTDALRTVDQFDMFNGAPDRYNWTLVGKREIYVPYNAYRLHAKAIPYENIIKSQHINQDYTRYELHRVWVVDAQLKPDKRHIYARRTFYIDEDSWQILAVDQYDARGKIWRVSEAHPINYYEVPMIWSTLELHYDLQSRRYLAFGLDNQYPMQDCTIKRSPSDYTPASLRRSGKRLRQTERASEC